MKKIIGWTLTIVIGLSLFGLAIKLVLLPFFVADTAIESAKGVVETTLDSDNVLHNYEKFKDLYNGAKQQVSNIKNAESSIQQLKETYGEPITWTKDIRSEHSHLTSTLEGFKQQYQRTVSDYNSDSSKLNRNLFKDKDLPYELPLDYNEFIY